MIKEIHIRSITKLEPQSVYKSNVQSINDWNIAYLDLWSLFWKWLLDLESQYSKHELFKPIRAKYLDNDLLQDALNLFANTENKLPSALELVFIYSIFNNIVYIFNSIYKNRNLSLWESLSHISNWFNPNTFNISLLKDYIDKKDEVSNFLIDILNLYIPKEKCICIFEFFWPSELLQILLLAKQAKKLWHTVILSSSKSNEQTDFTRWIDTFIDNPFLFENIDYYIPYMDFWKSLWILRNYLESWKPKDLINFENIVYKKDNTNLVYARPNTTSEEELFLNFTKTFYRTNFKLLNWKKLVPLRFMPYKCYWSWCFFCTINSSHLYPYKKNAKYIFALLDYIENNSIELINFIDEAIYPDDIILFAEEVIKRKLKIVYKIRARFDRKYTKEVCRLLYKSWMRYCWIGLECYSDRINKIINKWDITIKEKQQIASNFNSAWIPFHNYAIIWLPQETAEEMFQTYNFLKDNIENSLNYNCSPNSFWLNRWSYFAKNTKTYWLLLKESKLNSSGSLDLRLDFEKDSKLVLLQKKFASDLHLRQFLPFYKKNKYEFINPELFWVFVDRSGIFYYMKLFSRVSPFRKPYNYLKQISETKFSSLLENKYKIFKYIKIYPSSDKYNEWFNYWSWATLLLPKNFTKDNFLSYNSKKSLKENIINNITWSKLDSNEISGLVKWLFLF